MVALYAVTLFVSAALLFLVQPLFARMLLPLLGGAPAVWATAMVFYQAALLAGYAYAHASTRRLGVRRQAAWHLLILLAPVACLPLALPAGWTPPTETTPVPWLLGAMLLTVGLPFFALSTTSPLLQAWFASTGERRAADPYFLSVASNTGSLLALLSYPLWIEPRSSLVDQSRGWMWGYWLLVALVAACALALRRATLRVSPTVSLSTAEERPRITRQLRWLLLSFVPSSLMLGVTTYLSSEIAVVPLLWVVPLALYLLTFILAFARRTFVSPGLPARAFPLLTIVLLLALVMLLKQPIGPLMVLHLAVFFVAAWLCHGRLAADRPPPAQLTTFYLWLSLGGVLGGVFNALLAPLLFNAINEYPITLVLACGVALPSSAAGATKWARRGDWLWPSSLGVVAFAALTGIQQTRFAGDTRLLALGFGGAVVACYFFSRRPLRFALAVGALLLASSLAPDEEGKSLHAARSFFGLHRVTFESAANAHVLVHGATVHGRQSLDPARRREALTYYHASGPMGDLFAAAGPTGNMPTANIGVVGLGAGSLVTYARAGQHWTFFEIDPAVVRIARDPQYFSFLRDAPVDVRIVLADARLALGREPDGRFDLLILDAYSSDAIPVHLVTREALALYRRKLAPRGRLAFHISNRHLDLEPVFANLAREAGLVCRTRDDTDVPPELRARGKSPSTWMVMAARDEDLAPLHRDPRWRPGRSDERLRGWTDDYSSLLSVLRWR